MTVDPSDTHGPDDLPPLHRRLLETARAFKTQPSLDTLAEVARCLPLALDDPRDFVAIAGQVERQFFRHWAQFPAEARTAFYYGEHARQHFAAVERWRARVPTFPPGTPDSRRVWIVSEQVLGLAHAPTLFAFHLARLAADQGYDPLIVNANALPTDWYLNCLDDAIARYRLPESGEYFHLERDDRKFPVWTPPTLEMGWRKIEEIADFAAIERPSALFAIGARNMTADLLAARLPAIAVGTTLRLPLTTAPLFLARAPVRQAYAPDLPPAPRPFAGGLGLADLKMEHTPVTRSELGLPDTAFVVALAGNRLYDELTEGVEEAFAGLFRQFPGLRLLIFTNGSPYVFKTAAFNSMKRRIVSLGRQTNVGGLLAVSDAFVSPPGAGGGVMARLAIRSGLPIYCFEDSDAAILAGAPQCRFAAPTALAAALAASIRDPAKSARAAALAEPPPVDIAAAIEAARPGTAS